MVMAWSVCRHRPLRPHPRHQGRLSIITSLTISRCIISQDRARIITRLGRASRRVADGSVTAVSSHQPVVRLCLRAHDS